MPVAFVKCSPYIFSTSTWQSCCAVSSRGCAWPLEPDARSPGRRQPWNTSCRPSCKKDQFWQNACTNLDIIPLLKSLVYLSNPFVKIKLLFTCSPSRCHLPWAVRPPWSRTEPEVGRDWKSSVPQLRSWTSHKLLTWREMFDVRFSLLSKLVRKVASNQILGGGRWVNNH